MTRIYLCPAMLDGLLFLIHFAVFYAAGEQGFSLSQCAWLGGVYQAVYLAASVGVGSVLTRSKARPWLLASTVLSLAFSVACLVASSFTGLMLAMGGFGAVAAVFFNSFQTFMRGEAPPGGLARSVGLYTLAWSMGAGLGFLSSGALHALGRTALGVTSAAMVGAVLWVLLWHPVRPADIPSADEHVERGSDRARPVTPQYVWVGWLLILTGMFMQRPIHTFYPALSAREGIGAFAAGVPLFLQMAIQALTGLACARFRDLMYRRAPLVALHAGAALVLLALWAFPSYWVCLVGVSLLGVYTGSVFFASVYYASNSGRRSFNIGVNESLVGVGSFGGLLAAERAMAAANGSALYLVGAAALTVSLVLQVAIASLWPFAARRAAGPPSPP
jgi:predicted MFS family arabinose efflux permease